MTGPAIGPCITPWGMGYPGIISACPAAPGGSVGLGLPVPACRGGKAMAAAVIRSWSDTQLANAAAVSLYADAPLTCQFVLEDHAVRHSYHHLAHLRRALRP